MPDMLVRLYDLPPAAPLVQKLRAEEIIVRRAYPFELSRTRRFITRCFSEGWADEAEASLARLPVGCFIAIYEKKIVGFACVEGTAKGFFGPTGVDTAFRGRGIGAALLLAALEALRDSGYTYGIIGGVGPADFYSKACGATLIPDSAPGMYRDMLGPDKEEPPKKVKEPAAED